MNCFASQLACYNLSLSNLIHMFDIVKARFLRRPARFEGYLRKTSAEIYAQVLEQSGATFNEKAFRFFQPERCQRLTCACGASLKFWGITRGFGTSCSTTCKTAWAERHVSIKKTVKDRYDVEHVQQVREIADRRKATNLTRYGNICSAQDKTISNARNQMLRTNRVEINSKRQATNLKRYGCKNLTSYEPFLQAKTVKTKAAHVERWTEAINLLPSIGLSLTAGAPGAEISVKHTCGHIYEIGTFISTKMINDGRVPMCKMCYPGSSKPEQTVIKALREAGLNVLARDRTIIKPLELDLVLPDHKIAIEINGVYWHRAENEKISQLEKITLAEQAGYRLLHFWDFEVERSLDIIIKLVKARCGMAEKTAARSCDIVKLGSKETGVFLRANHLQGTAGGSVRLGLKRNDVLVAVAVFGKSRYKKGFMELIRFATDGKVVVGGLSRLVKAFRTLHPEEQLISYADCRYTNGKGYEAAGWKYERTTKPSYLWVHPEGTWLTRHQTQKHLLPALLTGYDPALSEAANMTTHGFFQVKDCGNRVYAI